MSKKKEDLRIRRTRKLLSGALIDLMKKKPFEKITVRDICDTAMVHRSTFYTHFSDKYELLQYCLGDFKSVFDQTDITENSLDGYRAYYLKVAREIAKEIQNNRDMYRAFVKKNHEESIMQRFHRELELLILKKLKKCEPQLVLPVPPDFLATFYSGACMSVLVKWLESNDTYHTEEIIHYLDILIQKPF